MKTSHIFILLFLGLAAFAIYFTHQPPPPDPSPIHTLSELKLPAPTPRLAAPAVISERADVNYDLPGGF
jgi:hypothetical protein